MKSTDILYIGIPYETHGKPPLSADCWTLCRYFARQELAMEWPRYMYAMDSQTEDSVREIDTHMRGPDWEVITERPIDFDKIQRGDLLIMTVAGHQQHCGVVLDQNEFLHSIAGRNSTLERISRWASHIDAVIRWRG